VLDRLIDIVLQFLEGFRLIYVVDEYEQGVVLRMGRYHRQLGPGWHWVIPLFVERVIVDNVVPRTMNMGSLNLTTSDGMQIGIGVIITAKIHDIRKALLCVEAVDDAMRDVCYAEIATVVHTHTWGDLQKEDINEKLLKACRPRAFTYGIEIIRAQISDLSKGKSLFLWNQQN
jgi:regulator of protease activity HflC (stomatin/prohibitin superfamily)